MNEIPTIPKEELPQEDVIVQDDNAATWLDDEIKNIPVGGGDFEKLPAPVFADKKITTVVIDATQPFKKWTDPQNQKVKAIIPCHSTIEGKITKCNWWLNIQNPVYKDVIHKCRDAENKAEVTVKVLQTGTKAATQYTMVEE